MIFRSKIISSGLLFLSTLHRHSLQLFSCFSYSLYFRLKFQGFNILSVFKCTRLTCSARLTTTAFVFNSRHTSTSRPFYSWIVVYLILLIHCFWSVFSLVFTGNAFKCMPTASMQNNKHLGVSWLVTMLLNRARLSKDCSAHSCGDFQECNIRPKKFVYFLYMCFKRPLWYNYSSKNIVCSWPHFLYWWLI